MSVNKRSRSAQYPLVAEYVFNYNDGVAALASLSGASVDGTAKATVTDFGSKASPNGLLTGTPYSANVNSGATYFEIAALPIGAQVIGGDVQIEVPFAGPSSATLAIGDVNAGTLYLPTTNLEATAAAAGFVSAVHTGNTVTMTFSAAHGISTGNIVNVAGASGAGSAVYNGSYIVDSTTTTTVTFTSINGTADAANTAAAGTVVTTFIAGRVALSIPGEQSGQPFGSYGSVVQQAYDAAAGADLRGTLTLAGGQAATQGRVRIRVMYTLQGRGNEVITT